MASTDKTPKLGLNQWAAGDDVLRADFNADNGKIEAGIEATKALVEANRVAAAAAHALAAGKTRVVDGSFIGDGTDHRKITLGFRPVLLIIIGKYHYYGALVVANRGKIASMSTSSPCETKLFDLDNSGGTNIAFLEDGIELGTAFCLNQTGEPHHYVAFA